MGQLSNQSWLQATESERRGGFYSPDSTRRDEMISTNYEDQAMDTDVTSPQMKSKNRPMRMQNHPSSFHRTKTGQNSAANSPSLMRNSSDVQKEGEASMPRSRGGGKKTDAVSQHTTRNTVKEERPVLNTQEAPVRQLPLSQLIKSRRIDR